MYNLYENKIKSNHFMIIIINFKLTQYYEQLLTVISESEALI